MQLTREPKVFGQLYIVVFDNGTVKAGMSAKSASKRIATHATACEAFCISLDSSFIANIYTNNVRSLEQKMHSEIRKIAIQTSGKEWFKFNTIEQARYFSENYIKQVEFESYENKPTPEDIDRLIFEKKQNE